MIQEFYLNYNIKCCNAMDEYEKGLTNNIGGDSKLTFDKNWVTSNKYIYKSIINKPIGLPGILLSSANEYLYIVEFYKLFNSLNLDIITNEDLDKI